MEIINITRMIVEEITQEEIREEEIEIIIKNMSREAITSMNQIQDFNQRIMIMGQEDNLMLDMKIEIEIEIENNFIIIIIIKI